MATAFLRNRIKQFLLKRNAIISRPPGQFNIDAIKYEGLKKRGLSFTSAIDGGAARGDWAKEFRSIFKNARVLCIEPRENAQPALRKLAAEESGIEIAQVLVGEREAEVHFNQHDEQSSILPSHDGKSFGSVETAQMTTLDALVKRTNFGWPDYIKLDLQGYELSCLRGAGECLKHAQAVQLEVSFIPFQEGMPLVSDVIVFMAEAGFRVYDILGLWHRPLDGALAQGDFLFLRKDHPALKDNRWSETATW